MESPYEARIREDLEQTSDPTDRAILLAERATYAARIGYFDDAEIILNDLRRDFGDGRSGRVTVMMMCAEGVLAYFRDLDPRAHERLARAQLLSVAAKSGPLSALTSAWLAHIDFNLHRHDDMARAIRMCLGTACSTDLQAKCRISLTLGDAFLVTEQRPIAQRWYARAHEFAVKLGDHAAVGALTYNQAALGVFNWRLASLESTVDFELLNRAAAEVRSARNYQGIAQLRSLDHLLDDAQASILILQHRFDEAISSFDRVLAASAPVSPSGHAITSLCDTALCYASLGRRNDFDRTLARMNIASLDSCNADDQAVAYGALQVAYRLAGHEAEAIACERQMKRSLEQHRADINSLHAILEPFEEASFID